MTLALYVTLTLVVLESALELIRVPWKSLARPHVPARTLLKHCAIKWLGTMMGLVLILFAWWLFPEYQRPKYEPLFEVMPIVLPWVPVIVGLWIYFSEWRLGPAKEGGWHLGLLLLGRRREVNTYLLCDDLMGWLVKGIFLPINFCELTRALGVFRGNGEFMLDLSAGLPWGQVQSTLMEMIYALLIAAIIPGYLFSARLLNTHLRKADHTWMAWVVTLSCYSPLSSSVLTYWFHYGHLINHDIQWMLPWVVMTQDIPVLYFGCGGLILLLELIHCWGEALFGIRASNLSHRGIITNGPLRFCKHPIYLVKCIAWGLMWLPFTCAPFPECMRATILYFGVCGIYMLRGFVEERLLHDDPDYRAYALWIDRHGMFAWLGRAFPPLSFQWRVARWEAA